VHLDPIWLPNGGANMVFENSMLFWTGQQREAEGILQEQRDKISSTMETLLKMRDMAAECRDALLMNHEDLRLFGKILDLGWQAKRSLTNKISSSQIDSFYARALEAGAYGGKIAGAGGGGFLYLVVPQDSQERVRRALSGMVDVPIKYEPRGVRLLSVV
jgi:D-glycero-alpha-D-manno-heptose-7-phosphate kinase